MAKRRKTTAPSRPAVPAARGEAFLARRGSAAAAALAALLYLPTAGYQYVLDDDFVVQNRFVRAGLAQAGSLFSRGYFAGFDGSNDKQYRPLVLLSFALEQATLGLKPAHSHLINVALYALAAALTFRLAALMFPSALVRVAAPLTLLFVVHPIHTEVVANVKSRDELLAYVFGIASLASLPWRPHGPPWTSVAFFTLALFTKESALTLLACVPLALFVFGGVDGRRLPVLTAPFAAAAAAFLLVRASVLDRASFGESLDPINNTLAMAPTASVRLATAVLILGKYLLLLLVPHPLTWDYSYAQIPLVTFAHPGVLLSLAAHALLLGFALWRLPRRDPAAFGILFHAATLSITSNLVIPIGATMAERFLFTPSFGACLAIAAGAGRSRVWQAWPRATAAALVAIAVLGAGKTLQRSWQWRDDYPLFRAGVVHAPRSARAHFALASEHRRAGEAEPNGARRTELLRASVDENRRAVHIYPRYAQAWYNLGVTHGLLAEGSATREAYERALAIDASYEEAENNLGVLDAGTGDLASALRRFERAVALNPTYVEAARNLAATYFNRGDYERALERYDAALAAVPGEPSLVAGRAQTLEVLRQRGRSTITSPLQAPHPVQ